MQKQGKGTLLPSLPPKGPGARWALWTLGAAALLVLLLAGSFLVSPWPGVLLIRTIFDAGAAQTSQALERHVPPGIVEYPGEVYDATDPDGRFDLYLPPPGAAADGGTLPLVVWVHGGGGVSGRRGDIGNYARILAGHGMAVASLDYSTAPEAVYPTPVRQVNAALGHLAANAARWGLAADRFVLAGDSAGAQIVAQVANLTVVPAYSRRIGIAPALGPGQLRGLLLFCGPYNMRLDGHRGLFRAFMRTVLWAYSGTRSFEDDPRFAAASVIDHVTADFPPAFISAGNADPLLPDSKALAEQLEGLGVTVQALFFPDEQVPPLPHEYQFNLDTEAGQIALQQAVAFVREQAGPRR